MKPVVSCHSKFGKLVHLVGFIIKKVEIILLLEKTCYLLFFKGLGQKFQLSAYGETINLVSAVPLQCQNKPNKLHGVNYSFSTLCPLVYMLFKGIRKKGFWPFSKPVIYHLPFPPPPPHHHITDLSMPPSRAQYR